MCVDDYEFRHYTAQRHKECRRFVFINQDDIQKAYLVNIAQFQQNGEVALCKILFYLSSKGLQISNRKFYWPKYNISIQAGDYCKVPFQALQEKQMMFHSLIIDKSLPNINTTSGFSDNMEVQKEIEQNIQWTDASSIKVTQCFDCSIGQKNNQNQKCHIQSQSQISQINQEQIKMQDPHPKRVKQPQRLIGEVIIAVKKWRKLYQSKKLNLTKASKHIGMSKKSLDDYYLVLRVGQILGFDYNSHLNSKMGDLRAYIRTFDYKVTGKLTKQVKCFQLVPDFSVDHIMQSQNSHQQQNQRDEQTS